MSLSLPWSPPCPIVSPTRGLSVSCRRPDRGDGAVGCPTVYVREKGNLSCSQVSIKTLKMKRKSGGSLVQTKREESMCLRVSQGSSTPALVTRGVGQFFVDDICPVHPEVAFHMST